MVLNNNFLGLFI